MILIHGTWDTAVNAEWAYYVLVLFNENIAGVVTLDYMHFLLNVCHFLSFFEGGGRVLTQFFVSI